ncbi:MAG: hypothetical protein PVH61_40935 [Candidatus Aminicenantes bacterium]|jgi:WD40 repeat protein
MKYPLFYRWLIMERSTSSDDNTIKLWDIKLGKKIITFKGHKNSVNSFSVSSDRKQIISCSFDGTIRLYDLKTGKGIRTMKGHRGSVNDVIFSTDGKYVISASDDHTIKLWYIESGKCIKTIELLWIPLKIKEVIGNPGHFATANANGTISFFDFREFLL